jgi:hypothetical protein
MSRHCAAAACGLLLALPDAAPAATLTAFFTDAPIIQGTAGPSGSEAFRIIFDDALGSLSGVLEGSEFQSFAWVSNPYGDGFRELLGNAPTIAGLIQVFRTPDFSGAGVSTVWVFRQGIGSATAATTQTSVFTYQITGLTPPPPPPAVPLPATGVLLVGAVAGLGALRRRAQAA